MGRHVVEQASHVMATANASISSGAAAGQAAYGLVYMVNEVKNEGRP